MNKATTISEQPVSPQGGTATSTAPIMQGVVVSAAMQKTLVVKVDTLKTHPKYLKQYRSTKRYKVHVEDSSVYALGSVVSFQECRPMSRDKQHKVIVTSDQKA